MGFFSFFSRRNQDSDSPSVTIPPQPKRVAKPRRKKAKRARVGWQPAMWLDELADNCVKCGRPLTNHASRVARVGTRCIQLYGPQPKKIRNPEHRAWEQKANSARSTQFRQQGEFNHQYDQALKEYAQYRNELALWKRAKREARRH